MTVERARAMRKALTPQELTLWLHLRRLKVQGWHFRRQSPEAGYTLDFVCRAAKLAIEVDGGHHAQGAQADHDKRRDEQLRKRGFRVLRIWNREIDCEFDGVCLQIEAALGQASPTRRARTASAPDTLPLQGRELGRRYHNLVRLGLRKRT